ncbi:hypothetical protein EGI22_11075 [Lacihabitans sp. LS3-19]|uniref:hypothetical protein n=1 Tax=Lacihabitans sp. LS3-19 TaxID=2487335 RepID=UPI0020CC1B44|nr:hypothetical protein [Lacihabitans sp. LS3-19]MCP9768457.1 hypothetical protein [Lacihabitans sp. LS3-19]
MSQIKDYTKLPLEELLIEQKKIKKQQLSSAVLIGILIGLMIYGIFSGGFGWVYISISIFMIYIIYNGSKKLKLHLEQITAEINKKA